MFPVFHVIRAQEALPTGGASAVDSLVGLQARAHKLHALCTPRKRAMDPGTSGRPSTAEPTSTKFILEVGLVMLCKRSK